MSKVVLSTSHSYGRVFMMLYDDGLVLLSNGKTIIQVLRN